ncbi:hypothetical protein J3L16_03065 [Alteromonas sp. 5E99-2]|uniref:hypothetical protein n=1 Tax=Alteromonas sp. 5E99-2 TaxID=2817683 RepID=UPI001A9961EF|nr:hypothetical protein [Alteromonas sp. 5E99-2]MBO1254665.1 hypothetical protein [Alteromonas sp. 5E99-2]
MKKWVPITLSLLFHGVVLFFIAKSELTIPLEPKKPSPLKAVLYFLSVPKDIQEPPETITEEATFDIEEVPSNTELVVPEAKAKAETPIETVLPLPEKITIDEPFEQEQISNENSTAEVTAPSPVKSKLSIADATRNALSVLQSESIESIYQEEKAEFDNQDTQIIENAPRYTQEQLENRHRPQPVDINCQSKAKKALAIASNFTGGRLKCRKNSNEQINSYINKHLNKETQQRRIDDKFDQKAK